MRVIPILVCVLFAVCRGNAAGQSLVLQAAAGPTIIDTGYSAAAGIGFFPTSRVAVLVDVERTHLSTRVRTHATGGSIFRGGTLTLAAPQLRVTLFDRDRLGPYGVVGFAVGVSQPNVTRMFRDRITNSARAVFVGGGIHVPVQERLSVFADVRLMMGVEAGELLGVAPVRAGVAWYF
jgi:hypothetical protein